MRKPEDLQGVIQTFEKLSGRPLNRENLDVADGLVHELLRSKFIVEKYKIAIRTLNYGFAVGSLRFALGEDSMDTVSGDLAYILGYVTPMNNIIEHGEARER